MGQKINAKDKIKKREDIPDALPVLISNVYYVSRAPDCKYLQWSRIKGAL